jgi:hypothetical protein
MDHLCSAVVTAPGYRSRGHGYDYRRYQIFWKVVSLKGVPLNLVRINEEILEWKVEDPVYKSEISSREDALH